ncbi:MAG: hypothetical protein Q8R90_10380 [Bacteroidales bacterium]|nr:hypothetical protein [Bacteroidales bacterium]
MKTKFFLLIIPFLLLCNIAIAAKVKVEVKPHSNSEGVRTGNCVYIAYELDGNGNRVHLVSVVAPCPKYSQVAGQFVVDFSKIPEMSKVLIKDGYKKGDLKEFVLKDYKPEKAGSR